MVCAPAPATAGSKLFPLTPVPLNVPPAGLSPLPASAYAGASTHTELFAGQVTTGNAFTVMVQVHVFEQPLPSV